MVNDPFHPELPTSKWTFIKGKCETRDRAIAALHNELLPLKETLEAHFGIRICYISRDVLPGGTTVPPVGAVEEGIAGQYEVMFHPGPPTNVEHFWKEEKAIFERSRRERLYNITLRQTAVRKNQDDLWDDDMQFMFKLIMDDEMRIDHKAAETPFEFLKQIASDYYQPLPQFEENNEGAPLNIRQTR